MSTPQKIDDPSDAEVKNISKVIQELDSQSEDVYASQF